MPGVRGHRLGSGRAFPLRRVVQTASAVLLNGYAAGFASGKVFSGPSKGVCVPVLNCSSCPGALGSCPIGALQASLGVAYQGFPAYVLGFLMLFGVIMGRFACGFLCPFGFIQDLLHKIPTPKLRVPPRTDRALRWLKYLVLALLVVALPLATGLINGVPTPFFCEYLCPAGTLQAGIPLLAADPALRGLVGALFSWKVAVLLAVIVASVLVSRPFCKYLCPLGAFYGLFNRFSAVQLSFKQNACVGCAGCVAACPMGIDPRINQASPECIRCGACKRTCPVQALSVGLCTGFEPLAHQKRTSP